VLTSLPHPPPANPHPTTRSSDRDLTLTGNSLNNVITANNGNDTLVAGSGIATMNGGSGNDTFVVNNAADVVNAKVGGLNTVLTRASYVAPAILQRVTGIGARDLT